jgi:hypothetical protein
MALQAHQVVVGMSLRPGSPGVGSADEHEAFGRSEARAVALWQTFSEDGIHESSEDRKGNALAEAQRRHKDVVRLLKAGQSVRNAAKIAPKGNSTVQRVKLAMASSS